MSDKTIDQIKFLDVAKILAAPLARQNYLPAQNPKTTQLLIMVYWGTTNPSARARETVEFQNASTAFRDLQQAVDPATKAAADIAFTGALTALHSQDRLRQKIDGQNARLLGYDSWWEATARYEGTTREFRRQDMLNELEEDRYFVVLMAYDFQLMWKQKKPKLLWETRFSVSERQHEFDRDLPDIAAYAASYFGQDSHGLIRKPLREASVELGELKNLGEASAKK